MGVSVVVPTHNRPQGLRGLLLGLAAQEGLEAPPEVVVVDSPEGEGADAVVAEVRARTGLDVRLVLTDNAIGHKRNVGVTETRGEHLVFLDDDMRVGPRVVAAHVAALTAHPRALICGSVEFPPPWVAGSNYYRFKNSRHMNRSSRNGDLTPVHPHNIVTMNLGVARSTFEAIGGFDDRFRHYGGEDVELGFRAVDRGYPLLYSAAANAWHHEVRLDVLGYAAKLYENAYYGTPRVLAAFPEARLVVPTWRWTEPTDENRAEDRARNLLLRLAARPRLVASLAHLLRATDRLRACYSPTAFKALTLLVQQVAVSDRLAERDPRADFRRADRGRTDRP